jgi:hypothetical protein
MLGHWGMIPLTNHDARVRAQWGRDQTGEPQIALGLPKGGNVEFRHWTILGKRSTSGVG